MGLELDFHVRQTQLVATLQHLIQYKYDKIQVDITILDFSKAFATVPHNKILYKLKHYEINSNTLKWIGNFLKQEVKDGKISKDFNIQFNGSKSC